MVLVSIVTKEARGGEHGVSAMRDLIVVSVILIVSLVIAHTHVLCVVRSGSMIPTLQVGDLIIVNPFDHNVKEGDVIVYIRPGANYLVIHRVHKIYNDGKIMTKGDHNCCPDPYYISNKDIIGKWTGVKVPLIGYFILFLRGEILYGLGAYILISLVILFFVLSVVEVRKKDAN